MEDNQLVPEKKAWYKDPFNICLVIQIILSIGVLAVLVTFAVFLSNKFYVRAEGAEWTVFLWLVTLLFVASNIVAYVSITSCADFHKNVFMWINIALPAVTIALGLGFGIPMHGQSKHALDKKLAKYIMENPKDLECIKYFSTIDLDSYNVWLERRTYLAGNMVFSFISIWGAYELVFIIWINCFKVGKNTDTPGAGFP